MKKRFSLIAVVVLSISLLVSFGSQDYYNAKAVEGSDTHNFISDVMIVFPPVKAPGKKTKTVIPPTKKRVSATTYRTMA